MKTNRDHVSTLDDVEKSNKKLKLSSTPSELNSFLFKDVVKYLVLNNDESSSSFKSLLELSLLSKSCFKIIQNLIISYDFYKNNNKFILSFDEFIKYIKTSTTNNNNYQFKLIQYKEIEFIKFNNLKEIQRGENENYLNKIKLELNKNCEKLKKVVILNYKHNNKLDQDCSGINQDYTCNGFYKFKTLSLFWCDETGFPKSINGNEDLDTTQDEDDDEEYNEDINPLTNLKYSFKFLNKYKPTNLKISTSNNRDTFCQLNEINNILINCNSIKRINFKHHYTPLKFFNLAIKNGIEQDQHSNLKSLKVRLESISNNEFNFSNSNNTIKELIFRNPLNVKRFNSNSKDDLECLINSLKTTSSIETLGLESFEFEDHELLSPLIELSNISTLICSRYNLEAILQHVNENQNIKHLILKDQKEIVDQDDDNDEIRELLSSFFNDNKSSLQLITIKIKNDNDEDLEGDVSGENEIIKSHENSPSFKTLNLNIKKLFIKN